MEKESIKNPKELNILYKKEKMAKKNETGNFISLIIGIILIIAGLGGTVITIPMKTPIILAPIASLVIGAFLALMGGLREW